MRSLKTLLIISGGVEAVPGILLAKKMGLHVVVSDGNQDAPGFEYSDDQIIASTYAVSETVRAAINYNENIKKLDGVICIASDVPLTVASVAEAIGLPGISIEAAKLAMDKLAMKIKFQSDGVSIPKFKQIFSRQELESVVLDWGYPVVVKPVDSRGARGVLRLTEDIDLKWAWNHSLENSPTGRVMVEKYLTGPQVSTESMMIDGKCYTVGFSDRNYEFLEKYAPFIIENGGDLPSYLPDEIQDEVKIIVEKAGLSMGIENGIVKGDIVIHDSKPYVIELAARLSGGYFCTHEIPLNSGVDLVGNAIKLAIGENINSDDLVPKFSKNICQRYIFPNPGYVTGIDGFEEFKNNKAIKYFTMHVKPGDLIEKPTAHPSRAGMVITEGDSRDAAKKSADSAIESLKFSYK